MIAPFIKEITAPGRVRRVRDEPLFGLPLMLTLLLSACAQVPPQPGVVAERDVTIGVVGQAVEHIPAQTVDSAEGDKHALVVSSSMQTGPTTVIDASVSTRPSTRVMPNHKVPSIPQSAPSPTVAASRLRPAPQKPLKVEKPAKLKTQQAAAAAVELSVKPVSRMASKPLTLPPRNDSSVPASAGERERAPSLPLPALQPQPERPSTPSSLTAVPAEITAQVASSKKHKRLPPARVERLPIGDTQLEMVKLHGGPFLMGSRDGDVDERPLHTVSVPPFKIGRFEVTQRQWQGVMGTNPSFFTHCANCPVDSVSWDDIQLFLNKLNQQPGKPFRLPSEAEWEYACRAGESEGYCGDSDGTQVAWFATNSGSRTQPVGQLAPNGFGLYDMSGNVYEWVADCWHSGYGEAPADGSVWSAGDCQRRVLRGGAWYYAPAYGGATYRNANTPYSRFIIYGFRLAQDE